MFKKVMLLIIVSLAHPLCAADRRPIITQLCTALATENNQKVRELFFQLPLEYRNIAHPDNNTVMNTLHYDGNDQKSLLMHAFYTTSPHAEANMDFLKTRGAVVCDGYLEGARITTPINAIIQLFAAFARNKKMTQDNQNALITRIQYAATHLNIHPIIQQYQDGPIHTALDTDIPMPSVVRCLIQHKADPNVKAGRDDSNTPLARVVKLIHTLDRTRIDQRAEWLETLYVLIEEGAKPGLTEGLYYRHHYGVWGTRIGHWTDGVDIWHEAIARQKKQGESSLEKQYGENPEWLMTRCAAAKAAQQARRQARQERREKEAAARQEAAEKARQDALRIAEENAAHAEAIKRAEKSYALYQTLKHSIERQNLTEIHNALAQGANPKIQALDNLCGANNLLEYAKKLYTQPDERAVPSSCYCGSQEARERQTRERRERLAEKRGEILKILDSYSAQSNVEARNDSLGIPDVRDSKHA